MADRTNYQRRTNSSYTRNASYGRYVSGNLAHQLEEVPQRRQQPQRRRRTRVYPKQKAVAMVSISAGSFFFLMVAGLITLTFCFNYLRVQSGITQMKNEVVALQASNAETKIANEEAYQKVMDTVDLSEVYQIATGELGMVQAVNNQVYQYNNQKSDMVKQYGDIPEAKK